MRSDIDPDVFLSVFQLRNELSDLGKTVSNERSTTIFLGELPEEMYSTIKMQSIRDPELGLEKIMSMMRTIFINHPERSSVSKRSKESYRKSRDNSGREATINGSAMATVITCHNCKRPEHKMKDCKQLMERSDESSDVDNGTRKWCSCHQPNGHSNEDYYQQQSESANSDNKTRWCSYHKSRSHSNDQCYHQRDGSRSSPADSKSTNDETLVADSNMTGCDSKFCCKCKAENNYNDSNDESYSPPPEIGFAFAACHEPLSQEVDGIR